MIRERHGLSVFLRWLNPHRNKHNDTRPVLLHGVLSSTEFVLFARRYLAPLDQLVRSSACHAEGQGFESPTVRQVLEETCICARS